MKQILTITSYVLFFCLLQACSGSKATTDTTSTPTSSTAPALEEKTMEATDPSGNWTLSIMDTPMGTVETAMRIEKDGDDYKAFLSNGDGEVEIEDFEVDGNTMTGEFYSDEYAMTIDFKMNYLEEKDELEGMMMSSFEVKGKRKM